MVVGAEAGRAACRPEAAGRHGTEDHHGVRQGLGRQRGREASSQEGTGGGVVGHTRRAGREFITIIINKHPVGSSDLFQLFAIFQETT